MLIAIKVENSKADTLFLGGGYKADRQKSVELKKSGELKANLT